MKRIIFTERQLQEVTGVNDFTYIDSNNTFNPYNGETEIMSGDKIETTGSDGKPTITDKISHSITPQQNSFMKINRCYYKNGMGNANYHNLQESNALMTDIEYEIPKKIKEKLSRIKNSYSENKNGIKRLNHLINADKLNTSWMERLQNFFNNTNPSSEEFAMAGGNEMKNWVNNELSNKRSEIKNSKEIKRKMGDNNAFIKAGYTKESKNGKSHMSNREKAYGKIKYEK